MDIGTHHSEETRMKMSLSGMGNKNCLGKKLSKEHRRNIAMANKGRVGYWKNKKMSEETKKKMSESNKGKHNYWLGKKQPEDMVRKRVEKLKGHTMSQEGKLRVRLSRLGKKMSEETKLKVSLAKKGKRCSPETEFKKGQFAKEKHRCWKGGISPINRLLRTSVDWKNWRTNVFKRDNFTCRICNKKGYLEAHHIMPFAKFPDMRFERANGLTLCKICHNKTKTGRGFLGR